jgi:hypothetical protein
MKKMSLSSASSMNLSQVSGVPFKGAAIYSPALLPQLTPGLRGREELPLGEKLDGRLELPLDELSFRHLQTAEEISRIVHLRQQIQLPAAALADPGFAAREKKRTKRASSLLSSAAEPTSGRFASSR